MVINQVPFSHIMLRYIWTRIAITSLILLGDGAFASEINPRSDIEADNSGILFQTSQQTFLDDPDSDWQPVLMAAITLPLVILPAKISFAALAHTTADSHKYHPLNPRAPPFPAK